MTKDGLILSQSEYAHLLEEIHRLQARITELTALRDDLVYHVCPALQAEYDEKIVSLERELMAANMYLHQMQRTIEILQAQMNRRQEPSMDEAEKQAKQENKEYEEDLHRKAEEARKFKEKWEESQWSKHDRQEREAGNKEKNNSKNQEQDGTDNGQSGQNGNTDGQGGEGSNTGQNGNTDKQKQDGASADASSGNSSGESRKDADGSSDPNEPSAGEKPGKEETTAQKIKRLYRKIVKRLHPDVHPNPTEHEKDLLNLAMKAFREGDLQQLERIWDELSGMDAPEDVFDDTPEGRKNLRELLEKLKDRLHLLELEIDHIKTGFPYKLKSFLEDPAAVEEKRRGIQSKIDNVREMNRQLEAYINELREKLRKGEAL